MTVRRNELWLQITFIKSLDRTYSWAKFCLNFIWSHISYLKMTMIFDQKFYNSYFFGIHTSLPSMDPHSQSLTLKEKNPKEASSPWSKAQAWLTAWGALSCCAFRPQACSWANMFTPLSLRLVPIIWHTEFSQSTFTVLFHHCYEFHCVPPKFIWSPNLHYLRMWPYSGIGSLQID